jgi:hypothetical protein
MRDDRLLLTDILQSAENIRSFAAGKTRSHLEDDKLLQSALLHELSVIGEAATKVSSTLKDKYPLLPWREISGFRNQIVHAYFSLDLNMVWETVSNDVSDVECQVKEILSAEFPQ